MSEPFSIVFALYPKLTQLDFTGPFEVLRRAPNVRVTVASRAGGEITADSGLSFAGVAKLAEIDTCDLICVPGGSGTSAAVLDAEFVAEVRRLGQRARYVTSVCTGSLILGAAGLIGGKRAACHWAFRDMLSDVGAIPDAGRVVRDGNVITGGGVTAGIDFALTVVGEVFGTEVAQAIQLSIEYDPAPPFAAGRPEKAPPAVLRLVRERIARNYPERKAAMEAALARGD
jgi:transcriptional regulator GlxA family with amidase domain